MCVVFVVAMIWGAATSSAADCDGQAIKEGGPLFLDANVFFVLLICDANFRYFFTNFAVLPLMRLIR